MAKKLVKTRPRPKPKRHQRTTSTALVRRAKAGIQAAAVASKADERSITAADTTMIGQLGLVEVKFTKAE